MERGLLAAITANTTVSAPLTEDDFFAAMRAVIEQSKHPRPPRCPPHLISPRARPGGWTLCSWCCGPVKVPDDWGP